MTNQFSEITQSYVSWSFDWKAYTDRAQHKVVQMTQSDSFRLCVHLSFSFRFHHDIVKCFLIRPLVKVHHIQSLSIEIPNKVMCNLFFWNGYMAHIRSLLHFSTETFIQTLGIVSSGNTFLSDATDMFIDKWLLRDELKILSKLLTGFCRKSIVWCCLYGLPLNLSLSFSV